MTISSSDTHDLTGKILIAMPGMGDTRFSHSVIYMCAHSSDGAMGLIVNKSAPHVDVRELLEQLGISLDDGQPGMHVFFGGPVEHGRGVVLHSSDYKGSGSTLVVDDDVSMTATLDILEDIAGGTGPKAARLMLGYAGWGPGQLEDEIKSNSWLICDASMDLVFDVPSNEKWGAALNTLGIDPMVLSATSGRA